MMKRKYRILSFILIPFFVLSVAFTQSDRFFEMAKSLEIFASLYRNLNKYYVDDLNPTTLANQAINSMLSSLDPYTNFIAEDQIEDYRTMNTGEYGGIGADVIEKDGKIVIAQPLEGYAAAEAGLRIGDAIIKINGVDITGRPLAQVERLLKGQSEGKVRLSIQRPGIDSVMDFQVSYTKVQQKNVSYQGMVTEDIGLVKLTDFTQRAGKEIEDAVRSLRNKGAQKIILDLRGNPGGLLNEAVNICNVFLPRGSEVVKMRGRFEEWNNDYHALNEPLDLEIPLAILIDNSSASASEIVSGVLQDYDRGVVIGQRSFGKGLVQTTTPLSYNSQLKVTVAKYYIPSGRCIQEINYSHKKLEEGWPLTSSQAGQPFKTKNNRTVFDGSGIEPDVATTPPNRSPIAASLLSRGLISDYAARFRNKNPEIGPARNFSITNQQYQDFVAWVSKKDFGYQTEVELKLDKLTASAKEERYYDAISSQIGQLKSEIMKNKAADLQKFKTEIMQLISEELVKHYYLQSGEMEYSFEHNPDILEAVAILNNQTRYKSVLTQKD